MSRPSPSKKGNEIKDVVKSPNDEFEEFISYVKVYVTTKMKPDVELINLPVDDIMGLEQLVILTVEDLKAVYNMEWATASIVRVYMRYVCMYVLNYLYTIVVYIRVFIRVYMRI